MSRRWRGTRDLVFEGIDVVSRLVEKTQREESQRWTERVATLVPITPVAPIARGVNALHLAGVALTHGSIRLIARACSVATREVTEPLLEGDDDGAATPMSAAAMGTAPWWRDHLEAAVNGLHGDFLAERGNPLDIGMQLRAGGRPVTPAELAASLTRPTGRLCVFVHGLTATECSWVVSADELWGDAELCFGAKLAEQGITPIYLRYNSGRHVSDNGRALAGLLAELVEHYPVPIEELTLVGHSMGGLVCRSAAHYAKTDALAWLSTLRHVFCIGSPHLGAPLEKGANMLSTVLRLIPSAAASVPAAILESRSAGIRDLRFGYTLEEEWRGEDPTAALHDNRHDVPLVDGVSYYAIAATVTRDPEHPAGQLLGDLLVRLGSASGRADEPERHIPFHGRAVIPGMNHLHLANHPAVYAIIARYLEQAS